MPFQTKNLLVDYRDSASNLFCYFVNERLIEIP